MKKGRLEAFSDGVIAIIITIMVLELKPPHSQEWKDLLPLVPVFYSYALSFLYVGIYWNNHHHLLHACEKVTGGVLWANLHLLFWMSLMPFTGAWAGENHFSPKPTALYGLVLFLSGTAYYILVRTIKAAHPTTSLIHKAVGDDSKGKFSVFLYATAVPIALWQPMIAMGIYTLVALMWIVPDKRIERFISEIEHKDGHKE